MPDGNDAKATAKKVSVSVGDAHKAKPSSSQQVEQGDNNAQARKGAIFLGAVVVAYVVFLVVTGQMATFLEALSNVDTGWVLGAAFCYVLYFIFGVMARQMPPSPREASATARSVSKGLSPRSAHSTEA